MSLADWIFWIGAAFVAAQVAVGFLTRHRQLSYALGAVGLTFVGTSGPLTALTIENVIAAGAAYALALAVIVLAAFNARKERKRGKQS